MYERQQYELRHKKSAYDRCNDQQDQSPAEDFIQPGIRDFVQGSFHTRGCKSARFDAPYHGICDESIKGVLVIHGLGS